MKQHQFLDVVDERTAHRRFDEVCAHLAPKVEEVPLHAALGRVLARDVRAAVDVPGFDRSDVDGFAVRAADTYGAEETHPVDLALSPVSVAAGRGPPEGFEVAAGSAVPVATGGVVPRGADAVVMVEYTEVFGETVRVVRASAPGERITFAGSDLGRGDLVVPRGRLLTSRETGMLAAVGGDPVPVWARPRVAILSTGDEIVEPGSTIEVGQVYDSNARILADAVREAGGEPIPCGIFPDDEQALETAVAARIQGAEAADLVLLSGGTSKGEGDVNFRVVETLARRFPGSPGIVVHGVALKPGKPVCLAVIGGKPVVILPGFPTSAIFTFQEFVAPLIRRWGGRTELRAETVDATVPVKVPSVVGRTQYVLVHLVSGSGGLAAYPLGAGSGSVSAFSRADGFLRIPDSTEFLDAGTPVKVRLLGAGVRPADLVAVGSHCVGLDLLLGEVADRGFLTKSIHVGSFGGLAALARGEGDVAGVHLLDGQTDEYNRAFLPPGVRLLTGYGRRQGLVFRLDDPRFAGASDVRSFLAVVDDPAVRMVNRNPGAGTRVLLDRFLEGRSPAGSTNQVRSHHAVAAAVTQGRADWGMTLSVIAREAGLGFLFVREERFDLAIPASRWDRPAVVVLREVLAAASTRAALRERGFTVSV